MKLLHPLIGITTLAAAIGIASPLKAQDHAEHHANHAEHSSAAANKQADKNMDKHSGEHNKPWSQADAYFPAEDMAAARHHVMQHHGATRTWFLMVDHLETSLNGGDHDWHWDSAYRWGGDIHKLWVKTEGEASFDHGSVEDMELQVLYGRAIAAFWDVQLGIRHDHAFDGKDGLSHAVLGINGLAPYWFEVDAAAFVSEHGDITARMEAEYELFLSQRLILQPMLSLDWAAQSIPEQGLGAGLNQAEAALRLRYEFKREFAPYIGITWTRHFDETRRWQGHQSDTHIVAGLRLWF